MKNYMVCGNAKHALKLNESESTNERYVLEGLFAGPFGVENRNKRIYQVDEYLKHLQYLRDDIKKGEPLLGELDHPDDRFEVKLKDVSHRVIDIWYDKASNTIQGKIELLNTPNGKLAQSLVDQGIPLHISSRAAGSVNNDKTVSINQIYTFDLVCKPGFAGAVLHRVNESEDSKSYTDDVKQFLQESEKMESMNAAPQFGLLNEDVNITEVSAEAKIRKEAQEITEDVTSKSNTDDNMINNNESQPVSEEVVKTEVTEEVNNNVSEKEDDEKSSDDVENTEDNDNNDEENKDDENKDTDDDDKGIEIISVRADTGSDEDEVNIEDVKSEEGDEESKEEDEKEESDDNKEENDEQNDETSECDVTDTEESKEDSKDADEKKVTDTDDKEKEMLLDCDELKDKRDKFEEKIDDLINAIKTKSEKEQSNESLTINKYPMSSLLNESNFKEFMKLDESEKNNVITYLQDNKMLTIESVNENWKQGIEYKQSEEVWLKYAPGNYRTLFENASDSVKASIKATAAMLLFENQYDVNNFWENTGLADIASRNVLNENFIKNMPKIVAEPETNELPYSKEFIQAVTEMACEYN